MTFFFGFPENSRVKSSLGSESPESFLSDDSEPSNNVDSTPFPKRHASPYRSESSSRASPFSTFDDENSLDATGRNNPLDLLGSLLVKPHIHTGIGLDWTLVSISRGLFLHSVSQLQRAVHIREVAREVSSRIEIKAITAFNGTLSGTLFRNPTFMQLPPSATFQELWIVHLDGPLREWLNMNY